ncbi:site-specific integrase [Xanthovirga aplysinae]|uniref:site-specific integrase n=1 Tax=Xanthovirga aplysinae TaxID=2529853 RepID=UPI0012BC27E4|nr:site-specific integrase [Xanthovirga aplysinae]MTI31270.1 site-specific integrase [Xanthovirga aplysinae]
MVTIRYKSLKNGKYSIYLDIYAPNKNGKKKRVYEFLKIYVTEDYSKFVTKEDGQIKYDRKGAPIKKKIAKEDEPFLKLAERIRAERELEVSNSINGYSPKNKIQESLLIRGLQEKYDQVKEQGRENWGLKGLIVSLKKFINNKDLSIHKVDVSFLNEFKKYLFQINHQNTIRVKLFYLKWFFDVAESNNELIENPFRAMEFEMPKQLMSETVHLTLNEIQLLKNTSKTERGRIINPHLRYGFLFACFTGLRYSDIFALKWSNIVNDEIILKPKKSKRVTGKTIRVPLSEFAKTILEDIGKNEFHERIFFNIPKKTGTYLAVRTWAKTAGINKSISFHTSRHTFATLGLTHNMDLYTMQDLLGHSTISMTQHYAKIVDQKRTEEIKKLPTLK